MALERGGAHDKALLAFQALRKLRPGDARVLALVGWAQNGLAQYRDAAEILEQAIALDPAGGHHAYNLPGDFRTSTWGVDREGDRSARRASVSCGRTSPTFI